MLRQLEHLVASRLDGTRLVHADVPRGCSNNALVRGEKCGNRDPVDLRAANEEENVRIGRVACLADELARTLAVLVQSVASGFLVVV